MDTNEVVKLIVMREQARFSKDWATADSIRDRLTAAGVSIFDKTHSWTMEDGRSGRIPTFAEIDAGQPSGGAAAAAASPPEQTSVVTEYNGGSTGGGGEGETPESEAHIKQLVRSREQARAQKDFETSDRIREELKAVGVEVFDKDKMWRSKSGACGVILGFGEGTGGGGGATDVEISTLVVQRERARQNGDFATSDMIRDELREIGVEIWDKEKIWKAADGRCGPVPTWDTVQVMGPGTPAAAQPMMRPGQAPPGGFNMQGSAGDLRSQVVQAALLCAQTPLGAARTLQLLQQANQAFAGPAQFPVRPVLALPAAPAQRSPPPRAYPQPPAVAPPPAALSGEHKEGVEFCRQSESAGHQLAEGEILWLVEVREKLRRARAFEQADSLRDAMKSIGLDLDEKEKRWTMSDGRAGAIPLWDSLA